jgi:hypothetical protein
MPHFLYRSQDSAPSEFLKGSGGFRKRCRPRRSRSQPFLDRPALTHKIAVTVYLASSDDSSRVRFLYCGYLFSMASNEDHLARIRKTIPTPNAIRNPAGIIRPMRPGMSKKNACYDCLRQIDGSFTLPEIDGWLGRDGCLREPFASHDPVSGGSIFVQSGKANPSGRVFLCFVQGLAHGRLVCGNQSLITANNAITETDFDAENVMSYGERALLCSSPFLAMRSAPGGVVGGVLPFAGRDPDALPRSLPTQPYLSVQALQHLVHDFPVLRLAELQELLN